MGFRKVPLKKIRERAMIILKGIWDGTKPFLGFRNSSKKRFRTVGFFFNTGWTKSQFTEETVQYLHQSSKSQGLIFLPIIEQGGTSRTSYFLVLHRTSLYFPVLLGTSRYFSVLLFSKTKQGSSVITQYQKLYL